MVRASRTLVKSVPELWAELSDPDALARHLEPFGAVRPTAAEAESHVAWEGELARGRVVLEPSGWGTRVTLEAAAGTLEPPPPPAPAPPPGWWARVVLRRSAPAPPPPEPPRPAIADDAALQALTTVLDTLGTARHRPFSRA